MAKITIEAINKEIEGTGWELLSDSYKNLKTELLWKCPERHEVYLSLERWRRKNECYICKENPLKEISVSKKFKKNKEKTRILAFDQAVITSGWALFDGSDLITYGAHTSTGNNYYEKLSKTKYWFIAMIEKYQPDIVILEDIQLHGRNTSEGTENLLVYKKLAAVQGILANHLYEKNIVFDIVSPSTWRHSCQIKGKSRTDKKKNAQLKTKSWYDVSVTEDEADAICIGKHGVQAHAKNRIIEF